MKTWMAGLCAAALAAGQAAGVQVGEAAPSFKTVDQDGNPWAIENHLGEKPLVIYFYPAAMTGGCTRQACGYRDYLAGGGAREFEVVGVSGDPPANLKYFQQAEGLNFTLLSDPDGAIAAAFGVPFQRGDKTVKRTVEGQPVELGRAVTTARWTFVVDRQGKVAYRDAGAKPAEDLDKVLGFLRAARR